MISPWIKAVDLANSAGESKCIETQPISWVIFLTLTTGNYIESIKAIYWDGRSENGEFVSSGPYFYQIETGDYTETKQMVILK